MPDTDNVLAQASAAVQAGNDVLAEELLRSHSTRVPSDAGVHTGLAILAHRRNDRAPSLARFRRVAAIAPLDASHQINMAVALGGPEAARPMRRALALAPGLADGHATFAGLNILPSLEQIIVCRRALAISSAHSAASINLALAFARLGHPADGVPAMIAAAAAAPLSVDVHFTLAGLLSDTGRLGDAAKALRVASAIAPDDPGVWLRASRVACAIGELHLATATADRTLALDRDDATARSNRLMVALYDADVSPADLLQLARNRHRRSIRSDRPRRPPGAHGKKPLHLAYLSADFRNHPIAYNIAPAIAAHDRTRVRVSCYADVIRRDAMTDRVAASADRWIEVTGRSDRAVAAEIAHDQVDVLVFLAGHTANNRLGFAGFRAADVQFSMLDVASSGAPDIDAIVLDPLLFPASAAPSFSEEASFVSCLFCFTTPDDAPPTDRREGDGSIVFGSFSNPTKVGPASVALWSPLLRALPGSRLILKYKNLYGDEAVRAVVVEHFKAAGVKADRIDFVSDLDARRNHLELYRSIDIALDPIPFNGCTTTFEALWMGVPVLTATADRMIGRMGASVLTAAGLTDLVAPDVDAFTANGMRLVADTTRRRALREQLRGRLRSSRLVDGRPLAKDLEDLFERAVERRRAA